MKQMPDRKELLNNLVWGIILVVIVVNFYLLNRVKQGALKQYPLDFLEIKKPTLVVLLDEFECTTCVRNLMFLNDMYEQFKGDFDFTGIILSKTKTDNKGIAKAFAFPTLITDNFGILRRLNQNQTPLIMGLSKENRIYYCDLIPVEMAPSEEYIRKGVLDRLYYSMSQE